MGLLAICEQQFRARSASALAIAVVILAFAGFTPAGFANSVPSPIQLSVDASDATRNIFHAHLIFATTPGDFVLVYPKWIPGNHRPSGPVANLVGLHFEADGKPLDWERDPLDMYAFHLKVPKGAHQVEASIDAITSGSGWSGCILATSGP